MDEGGVQHRRQQSRRQHPYDVPPQPSAPLQTRHVQQRAQQGRTQAERVHKKHGAGDDHGEIAEAHRRVAASQRILHGITSSGKTVLTF